LLESLKGRDHSEDLGGRIIFKRNLRERGLENVVGLMWLRIGTGGGLL
jgi:hypothetical protein